MSAALHISVGNAQRLPLDLLLSAIPSLPRHVLGRLVERAIDHMDEIDGDPDIEANGDELDCGGAEDEPFTWRLSMRHIGGPGCAISDPDYEPVGS